MAGSSLDAAHASASAAAQGGVMGGDCERGGYCGDRCWSLRRIQVRPCLSHRLRPTQVHKRASRVRPPWAMAASNATPWT